MCVCVCARDSSDFCHNINSMPNTFEKMLNISSDFKKFIKRNDGSFVCSFERKSRHVQTSNHIFHRHLDRHNLVTSTLLLR